MAGERPHICGWRGPKWLHISRLCATCKGMYPTLIGCEQNYGPPCQHPQCRRLSS